MTPKKYLVLLCSTVLFFTACEKYNQIDNTGIIRTPYVLYTGGLDGQIHKTNDANYFTKLSAISPFPIRQIITADTNILVLRKDCYVSDDNGLAFNKTNTNCLDFYDEFYSYFRPNQMCYDESEQKVYLCTKGGLLESADFGKTFGPSPLGGTPISVIEDDNGDLYAIENSATISKRTAGVGGWGLVAPGASPLSPGNHFYLSSFNGNLIATDYEGTAGVFESSNGGADWTKLGGVSGSGKHILFTNQPEGTSDLFMGRDSSGLFKLVNGNFESSSAGIPWYAKVGFVEAKRIVYRTGETKEYLFCATDVGLYVSESGGDDWSIARPGASVQYSTLK